MLSKGTLFIYSTNKWGANSLLVFIKTSYNIH